MSKKYFIASLAAVVSAFWFVVSAVYAQNYPPCFEPQVESQCPPAMTQGGYDCNYYVDNYSNCCPNYCPSSYSPFCLTQPAFATHTIYGRVEAVFWNLDDADKRPLILRDVGGANQSIFSGGDLDYSTKAAPRAVLGLQLTPFTAVEGEYTGFRHLRKNHHFVGNNDLSLPGELGTIPEYFNVDGMNVFSQADFHMAEINLVRRTGTPHFSWLAGFRYVNFEEKFELNSVWGTGAAAWHDDYRTRTKNDLYGGQLGVKGDIPFTERLGLQYLGKAGVYSNRARQSNFLMRDDNTTVVRDHNTKSSKTSFLGEINLGGYLKITENIRVVGGYNLMWIGDLARACDQMDFTFTDNSGSGSVRTDSVFMHGANAGVEIRF